MAQQSVGRLAGGSTWAGPSGGRAGFRCLHCRFVQAPLILLLIEEGFLDPDAGAVRRRITPFRFNQDVASDTGCSLRSWISRRSEISEDDIVPVALFLVSTEAGYVTDYSYSADG